MKLRVFALTCLAFSLLSTLRLCYAYVKPYIKQQFDLSNLFLALLDSLIYLALGIGMLVRYSFYTPHQIFSQFLTFAVVFNSAMLLVGLLSSSGLLTAHNAGPVLAVLIFVFGFFQCNAWPVLTVLLHDYFKVETDGTAIGLWSSSNELGNMLGVLTMPLLILSLGLYWELTLVLAVAACLISSALVYFFVPRRKHSLPNVSSHA